MNPATDPLAATRAIVPPAVNIVLKSLYACPHRCGFCHVLAAPRDSSYMSTAEVKAVFDEIERRFEGRRVELELSGGEFTIRKDAVELVEYLRARRIRFTSLVLDTMGVPLAESRLASRLGALFDKANVSIHSSDAETHARISGSYTRFEDLRAGLENAFRSFPAVFTNTSVNRENWEKLVPIARLILDARRAGRPDAPLYSLFYVPVYRRYGAPTTENEKRLPDEDNAEWVPDGSFLDSVGAEFRMARALLAREGALAVLRDFNMPACLYGRIAGGYPESGYGLPNFTKGTVFVDFAHAIAEEHLLEAVYPSLEDRTKPAACRECVAEGVCQGLPAQWLKRGYEARPLDLAGYAAGFPLGLLNQTLWSLYHDAVRFAAVVSEFEIDWGAVARSFYARLAGPESDIRRARDRIGTLPAQGRLDAIILLLEEGGHPSWRRLAARLREDRSRLAAV